MDVVACGLLEAGGSMSVYRGGAFQWCAPGASHACTLGLHSVPAGGSSGLAFIGPPTFTDRWSGRQIKMQRGLLACIWDDMQVPRMPACPGSFTCTQQLGAVRRTIDRDSYNDSCVPAFFPHQQLALRVAWQCSGQQKVLRRACACIALSSLTFSGI